MTLPQLGCALTQRIVSVRSFMECAPTQKCQCTYDYGPLSVVLWELKPSVVGCAPLGVPHSAERFSPLRAPAVVSLMGTQNTDISLQTHLI